MMTLPFVQASESHCRSERQCSISPGIGATACTARIVGPVPSAGAAMTVGSTLVVCVGPWTYSPSDLADQHDGGARLGDIVVRLADHGHGQSLGRQQVGDRLPVRLRRLRRAPPPRHRCR